MSIEDKIRGLAAKGEITHLSLVCKDGIFYARFAAASINGYASAEHKDPITALENVFAASPAKPKRVSKPKEKEPEQGASDQEPQPAPEVTATVTGPEGPAPVGAIDTDIPSGTIDTGFPSDWTTP